MILVIADDFSGAAEVAGAAHAMGFAAEVQTEFRESAADFVVIDSNTRGLRPEDAARVVAELAHRARAAKPDWLFKKTDSVLRGPVAAEVLSLARHWPFERAILVPSNPSRRRTLVGGKILIDGVPLAETHFATDPEYPAHSSDVLDLLNVGNDQAAVCGPDDRLPSQTLIVGNTSSASDLGYWAEQINDRTLASGGVEFFEAIVRARCQLPSRRPELDIPLALSAVGNQLLVCGTAAGWSERLAQCERCNVPIEELSAIGLLRTCTESEVASLASRIASRLAVRGVALVAIDQTPLPLQHPVNCGPANLARVVGYLVRQGSIGRIYIEGGAAASTIARTCGWSSMTVLSRLAPGVVQLIPKSLPVPDLLVKPGSYAWPDSVWSSLASATASN